MAVSWMRIDSWMADRGFKIRDEVDSENDRLLADRHKLADSWESLSVALRDGIFHFIYREHDNRHTYIGKFFELKVNEQYLEWAFTQMEKVLDDWTPEFGVYCRTLNSIWCHLPFHREYKEARRAAYQAVKKDSTIKFVEIWVTQREQNVARIDHVDNNEVMLYWADEEE